MYNAEQKTAFIQRHTTSIRSAAILQSFFQLTEDMERKFQRDLCTFNQEQLQSLFDSFGQVKRSTVINRLYYYRAYIKWAIDAGIAASDYSRSIVVQGADDREDYVGSPDGLQTALDKTFDTDEANSTDSIYRAYYWLAYSGVRQGDTASLLASDVSLDNMEVRFDGHAYPIYPEAVRSFENCISLDHFEVHSSMYGKPYVRKLARIEGKQLLRTTVAAGTDSWRSMIYREGRKPPVYLYIWKSGLFYRMFQREVIGIPVDFSDAAELYIQGRTYELKSMHGRIEYRKQRIGKQLEDDYLIWKERFSY